MGDCKPADAPVRIRVSVFDYVGREYRERGRGPDFDCWGLAIAVCRDCFGKSLPDYEYSDSLAEIESVISAEREHYTEVEKAMSGDLILLRQVNRLHIGVYLGSNKMIHASRSKRSCIERLDRWRHRVIGVYRVENNC